MTTGVTFQEMDQSFSIPLNVGGRICVAGPCSKGPIGEYMDINSEDDFKRNYGSHYASSNFPTMCIEMLKGGCKLAVSRVVHATDSNDISTITATYATVNVLDRNTTAAGGYLTTSAGPWIIDNGEKFLIDINTVNPVAGTLTWACAAAEEESGNDETTFGGFIATKTLTLKIDRGAVQTITFGGGTNTAALAVVDINSQLVGGWAEVTGAGPNWKVKIWSDRKGTGSYIEITGGTANAVGGFVFPTAEIQGTGDCVNHLAVTPTEFNTAIATLWAAEHGVTYTTTLTSTTITFTLVATGAANYIGWDTTGAPEGATIFGFTIGAGGDAYGVDAATANTMRIDGKTQGTWAANMIVSVVACPVDPTNKFALSISAQSGIVDEAEYYEELSMTTTDTRYYIDYVNERSRVIKLTDLASAATPPMNRPAIGAYTLTGGNNGMSGLVGTDFVGGSTSKLGVYAFDPIGGVGAAMDLLVPTIHEDSGSVSDTSSESIVTYCDTRRDMVFHQVPPDPDNVSDTVQYRNGTGAYANSKFNSSYTTLLFGEGEIDGPSGRKFVNAGAAFPYILSFTDTGNGKVFTDIGQWFAPCGEKRGKTRFYKIDPKIGIGSTERSTLEDAQINYLADMGRGPIVWNQTTMYVPFSALRDLNVRRLMIYLERAGVEVLRNENWEPNDPEMWRSAVRNMEAVLSRVKEARGLYDYAVYGDQDASTVYDVTVNTVESIDEGKYKMKVFVKPTRAAKEIQLVFIITATGVDFEEILDVA